MVKAVGSASMTLKRQKKRKLHHDVEASKDMSPCSSKVLRNNGDDMFVEADYVVSTPTRLEFIKQISIGLQQRQMVLVEGPIGCGKTTLVREIARARNLPLHIYQMGEQLDAKSLFGSFQCGEVPGDFTWKSSEFSKFLHERCMLLLEDIDTASPELISNLIDLCENRQIDLPVGGTIRLHDEVCIIVTIRTTGDSHSFWSSDRGAFLNKLPFHIKLPLFPDDELQQIIRMKYSRIAAFASTLISLFNNVCVRNSSTQKSSRRPLTNTDLFRACSRLNDLPDTSNSLAILTELIDVWAMHSLSAEDVFELSRIIADQLSINSDALEYHLSVRHPLISIQLDELSFGRAKLRRNKSALSNKNQLYPLGKTRDVCQMLERISICIERKEPVLLVGETGVGKTTLVQYICHHMNVVLHVVNFSQHTDATDLIGGYRPASIPVLLQPIRKSFNELFTRCFDVSKNTRFLSHFDTCLSDGRYLDFVQLICEVACRAIRNPSKIKWARDWAELLTCSERFKKCLSSSAVPFSYVRGAVAEATEHGDWLLVDEINLASSECLDALMNLLEDSYHKHPKFRLFACMNPVTDIGKKNLPLSVRSRFTEIFIRETRDAEQLGVIVRTYLPSIQPTRLCSVLNLYEALCHKYPGKYSLRSLCRALSFASDNFFGSDLRSLQEAIEMSFLTDLNLESRTTVLELIHKYLGKKTDSAIPPPDYVAGKYINVENYYIRRGTNEPQDDPLYVRTPSVRKNLAQLSRVVCSGRYPVLLEGETSTGKTAMVIHLAKISGNTVIRINNHEHTDLQEYIGSYAPDRNGKLIFMEGALLKAMKAGYWVILDELNLAASDVIEALNRLLDDNRELYVSELNTTVRAHQSFRLFATQNPAGSYAGRKRLSRALLNRFVILRFDHLPFSELSQMVVARCSVPPSIADRMISVLVDLRAQRSVLGVFSAQDGLMTLRDVFRWAKRLAVSEYTDWQQCLSDHGYFLLGARCRNTVDECLVIRTLEKYLKRSINPDALFDSRSPYFPKTVSENEQHSNIVLTAVMRRMIVLCYQAWLCNEPVLLVGETGCGKTTVAELLAKIWKKKLFCLNCHQHTETSDLLGSLRPVGNGTFKWVDGVVIEAMKKGHPLLIDEISLAADSVLERLNPLLETSRTLLLTDAGTSADVIYCSDGFEVIATMNPGGDYGKKELSRALRNRFTEIWCPPVFNSTDVECIAMRRLSGWKDVSNDMRSSVASCLVEFFCWFARSYAALFRYGPSIRDVVACCELFNSCVSPTVTPSRALFHSFSSVLFDAIGALPSRVPFDRHRLLCDCIRQLETIARARLDDVTYHDYFTGLSHIHVTFMPDRGLSIGDFVIKFGQSVSQIPSNFTFEAPTCKKNVYRIARALSIEKPILLEGSPGCGKSSSVIALASATGHPLTRLNLSEQTDLSDLFGSDIPIVLEDGTVSFTWKDGPVLSAIKNGHWILLDEMNLASQSVLEGLNACLDHRKQLFIAELNRSFEIGKGCFHSRFFACQNPRAQGGNRRALPKSFLNRFTTIYIEDLSCEDEFLILQTFYAQRLSEKLIHQMINVKELFLEKIRSPTDEFGRQGAPHDFNLRDLLRWAKITVDSDDPAYGYHILFISRLRTKGDRDIASHIFEQQFGYSCTEHPSMISLSSSELRIGRVVLQRKSCEIPDSDLLILSSQISALEYLAVCVKMDWLALLIGSSMIGKSSLVKMLANITGNHLCTMRLTSETDALELLGTFEQVTNRYDIDAIKYRCGKLLSSFPGILNDIEGTDDVLPLKKLIQSASYLVDEATSRELTIIVSELDKNSMRFRWVNSPFLDAYLNGYWIIIKNVNLCNAAVLDRLNSCLESDGRLSVPERGDGSEILVRHPNFRVFFTMDDSLGSISRAMRNRSVELFLLPEQDAWFKNPNDVAAMLSTKPDDEDVTFNFVHSLFSTCDAKPNKLLLLRHLQKAVDLRAAARASNLNVPESYSLACPPAVVTRAKIGRQLITDLPKWKAVVWSKVCGDQYILGFIWALLSTTKCFAKSGELSKYFPISDRTTVTRLSRLIENLPEGRNEYLPFDERFEGSLLLQDGPSCSDFSHADRIVLEAMLIYAFANIRSLKPAAVSVVELVRSGFTQSKMLGFSDVPEAIREIPSFISEAQNLLASDLKASDGPPHLAFEEIWNLVLFITECYRSINNRSGFIPLQLAWEHLRLNFFSLPIRSSKLNSLGYTVDRSWHTPEQDDYIIFEKRYKEHLFVSPFTTQEKYNEIVAARNNLIGFKPPASCNSRERENILYPSIKLLSNVFRSFGLINQRDRKAAIHDTTHLVAHGLGELGHIKLLEWKEEVWWKITHVLVFLMGEFAVCDVPGAIKNIELAECPLGTYLVLNVWRALKFDFSLSAVTLQRLSDFSLHSNMFRSLLWKLSPHLNDLSKNIRSELCKVIDILEPVVDASVTNYSGNLMSETPSLYNIAIRLKKVGLTLVLHSTPPKNMVDPVLKQEQSYVYFMEKLKLVEKQLRILNQYWSTISRCESLRSLTSSSHPAIKSLFDIRNRIKIKLDAIGISPESYRPSYSVFSRLSTELNNFSKVIKEWHDDVLIDLTDLDSRSLAQLEMQRAQIDSFVASVMSFQKRLLHDFVAYPDIIFPFIVGALCFALSLCILRIYISQHIANYTVSEKYGMPLTLLIEGDANRLEINQFYSTCVSSSSVMPKRLQYMMTMDCIKSGAGTAAALKWITKEWLTWYQSNIARKEKMYEYRETGKNRGTINEDDVELNELFPDYSVQESNEEINVDYVSPHDDKKDCLPSSDLYEILCLLTDDAGSSKCANMYLPLMWVLDVLSATGRLGLELDRGLVATHLNALRQISSDNHNNIIDVYRMSSKEENICCVKEVCLLVEQIRRLKETWPEMAVLDDILLRAKDFLALPANSPQMRLSASLEKLLDEVENWEKVADRKHSVSSEFANLRETLLRWRKMEVLCWNSLIDRVEKECAMEAVLVSWPLYEAFESERSDVEIIAMTIEWIQNSSLGDFEARLKSAKVLARFVALSRVFNERNHCSASLPKRIRSLARHFELYCEAVRNKVSLIRAPHEKQLKDFVKIIKYNDLNVWSVKLSAQKAHRQLFRVVTDFKKSLNSSAAEVLRELLTLPEIVLMSPIPIPSFTIGAEFELDPLIIRASQLSVQIMEHITQWLPCEEMNELLSFTASCESLVRTDIVYEGEDEEKEKAQGRAMVERHRAIAELLKISTEFGISARRGISVNSETLTAKSVLDISETRNVLEKLVRQGAASRDTVLKHLHKPNEQLSVNTIHHLRGITEFLLDEIIDLHNNHVTAEDVLRDLLSCKRMLSNHIANQKSKLCANFGHQQWYNLLLEVRRDIVSLVESVEYMKTYLESAPDNEDNINFEVVRVSGLHDTALSQLHKQHPSYNSVIGLLEKMGSEIDSVHSVVKKTLLTAENCADIVIWKSDEVVSTIEAIHLRAMKLLDTVSNISPYMPKECEDAIKTCQHIMCLLHPEKEDTVELPDADNEELFENLLLIIQHIFKKTVLRGESKEEKPFTRLKFFVQITSKSCFGKAIRLLHSLCKNISSELTNGRNVSRTNEIIELVHRLLSYFISNADVVIRSLSLYYVYFESIAVRLLEKGYVNAIPAVEKSEDGEMEMEGGNGVAGMGEGEGAKDVGEEIDSMEQIEGLTGEDESSEQQRFQGDENKTPIDVEDDFAGNLENIDQEDEKCEDESDGDGEDIDADQRMGKVEESEETKLDPEIWRDNKEQDGNGMQEMEHNRDGCREKIDRMVAKDSEKAGEKEQEDVRENEDDGENENTFADLDSTDRKNQESDNEYGDNDRDVNEAELQKNERVEENCEEEENELDDVMDGTKLDENESLDDGDKQDDLEDLAFNNWEEESACADDKNEPIDDGHGEEVETDRQSDKNFDLEILPTGGTTEKNDLSREEQLDDAIDTDEKADERGRTELKKCCEGGNQSLSEVKLEKVCGNVDSSRNDDEERNTEGKMKRLAETDADMSVGDLEEGAASEEVNEEIEKERYGHVDQGAGEVHERLAIDKSTVEEARRTRTGTEALREKLGQNLSEEKNNVNEIATEGEAAESSDTGKASRNDGLDNQNSIIHVQTSLLNLVEPLATADASSFQKDDDVVEGTIHAHDLWSQISDSVSLLSAELTESLRSVIEPTIASRLEGDYRSGKRLNMRRLISYIASDYRKDRIWLRRTKKSTRNYQILLAIDDSESMSYGKMKEITCQSICLIESALNRLEVGQLAICKFGRKVKLISDFTSSTESSLGGRLLSELTFSQDRTDLVNLMNAAKQIFRSGRDRSQSNQMMIIISDGRGALSGGAEKLKKALEAVAADTVTVLFIAVDNGSESIVDMQVAEFDPDGRVTLIPYMQRFPFSFYIVIREVSALPATLADAIRQWFEISLGSLPVRD